MFFRQPLLAVFLGQCFRDYILCINVFLWHMGIFSLLAAGLFSCSRLRGTQGARRNTTAQSWALVDVRGTCSGGSQSQVPTGRHSEHVGPSRSLQTHVEVKKECPTAHVISGILNVINVVRHYFLGDGKVFPRHQHARHATTFNTIRQISMTSEGYGLLPRI